MRDSECHARIVRHKFSGGGVAQYWMQLSPEHREGPDTRNNALSGTCSPLPP